jgi:hypothetical protein
MALVLLVIVSGILSTFVVTAAHRNEDFGLLVGTILFGGTIAVSLWAGGHKDED